jgi:suppressor of G2 allele of SKP1
MNTAGLKHDWFQTDDYIVLNILFKKALKENVAVDILEREVTATIKVDANREQQLNLSLAKSCDPNKSSYEVLSTKIEIKLAKKTPGRWNTLEPTIEEEVKVVYPSSAKKVLFG